MEVVKQRGVAFTVARIWDGVTREFERKLKTMGGLSRNCPICKLEKGTRAYTKKVEIPAAPATPEAGPDYVEVEPVPIAETEKQASMSIVAYDYMPMFREGCPEFGGRHPADSGLQ
jgi:hypothetical protein